MAGGGYPFLQGPAPSYRISFGLAAIFGLTLLVMYCRRVQRLQSKFHTDAFQGSLRAAILISAYIDDHEAFAFAIVRTCTKSFLFLGGLQLDYQQWGFVIMMGVLLLESSLDTIRILLAYSHCRSLEKVRAIADHEAKGLKENSKFEPTNVYEDFTRPGWIAAMVFLLQVTIYKRERERISSLSSLSLLLCFVVCSRV
jgi:hypothetical protein